MTEGAFASPALAAVLRGWAADTRFDSALASASSMVPYLRLPGLRDVPAVVDLVDVDSQKWLDFAAASLPPKRWLYKLEAARVRKLESRLPKWAKAVAVVSRAEADVYDSFAGSGVATVATNGVDLDYYRPLVEAGVQYLIVNLATHDDMETLELLAEQVIPALQG